MNTKTSSATQLDNVIADRIFDCAMLYMDIRDGKVRVPGTFDNAGRFYPCEHFDCCNGVRSPSRAFPHSLLTHSHSLQHVVAMNKLEEYLPIIRKTVNAINRGNYSVLVKLLGSPRVNRFAVEKSLGV